MASAETLSLFTQTPFAKEQLEEGLQRWPQTLRDCLTRATLFKSLQSKLQADPQAAKSVSQSLQAPLQFLLHLSSENQHKLKKKDMNKSVSQELRGLS
jgi:hypothetical protein